MNFYIIEINMNKWLSQKNICIHLEDIINSIFNFFNDIFFSKSKQTAILKLNPVLRGMKDNVECWLIRTGLGCPRIQIQPLKTFWRAEMGYCGPSCSHLNLGHQN